MKIPTPEFIKKDQLNHHERLLVKSALAGEDCELFDKKKVVASAEELWQAEAKKPKAERRDSATLLLLAIREQAAADAAPTIRADLIRFLVRGGNKDHPVDPYGVRLRGAKITGTLTLEGCRDLCTLGLVACLFDKTPILRDAVGQIIDFSGSYLSGLQADRLTTAGDVFLRQGFEATGAVRLGGAKIGGDLTCDGGNFLGTDEDGNALFADGLTTTGSMFLRHGFEAAGAVRLVGAKIGGTLECDNGKFLGKNKQGNALHADRLTTTGGVFLRDGFEAAGAVRLLGAKIGGNLECTGGKFSGEPSALNLQRGCVTGIFFWKPAKGDRPIGTVDLSSAEVGDLSDDPGSWPEGGVILDGFRYGRIIGAPTSYATRKDWLEGQWHEHPTYDFKPQPFEQLAHVLREMGHKEDAKRVAMLKQQHRRSANWRQAQARITDVGRRLADASAARRASIDAEKIMWLDAEIREARWTLYTEPIRCRARWIVSRLLGLIVGYGYRPLYAVGWAFAFVMLGWSIFGEARNDAAMVPNNPFLLKQEWKTAVETDPTNPYREFQAMVPDFQRLDPLIYSIDTFVPLVNLHQEPHWIPQPEGKDRAWPWTRLYLWVHILVGWIITALAAASLTGLVKKDV